MHPSVMEWVADQLHVHCGNGELRVCELGSHDVNGSVRNLFRVLRPVEYLGVDLLLGEGVDVAGDVASGFLQERYGSFDCVVATETLEHVQSWTAFVRAMKLLCSDGGQVLLTTRSPGFPRHDHPGDYWRFTLDDLASAFADCEVIDLRDDPKEKGVFLHARKPHVWKDAGLRWSQVATP